MESSFLCVLYGKMELNELERQTFEWQNSGHYANHAKLYSGLPQE